MTSICPAAGSASIEAAMPARGFSCGASRALPGRAAERGNSFAKRLRPRRVLRRFGGELAPNIFGAGLVPRLLGGKTEKKTGLCGRGILRHGGFERLFRFRRHHAIGGRHQGFAIKGVALGAGAQQAQRLARGMDGVSGAAHMQIHRRQNLIAAPIIWMLRKMRFDLGDRGRHVHGGGRRCEPGCERRIGQIRMADGRIKPKRERRDKNHDSQGGKQGSFWRRG